MHIHILGICGTFMGGLAALARAVAHGAAHRGEEQPGGVDLDPGDDRFHRRRHRPARPTVT